MEYLSITPGQIPTRDLHAHLLGSVAPRPIAFASTLSANGEPNLSPFSFFNVFGSNPPTLIFSPARRVRDNSIKDTLRNVYEVPEVVINVVNHAIVDQMNLASAEYLRGVDEFVKAGFTPLPSETIRPLRVQESPVQIECKVMEIKPLGNNGGAGNLIICRVQRMHIQTRILGANGLIDPQKIDLVGRMGMNYYARANGPAVFEVEKPLDRPAAGVDALPGYIRESEILTGAEIARLGNIPALPAGEDIEAYWAEHGKFLRSLGTIADLHRFAADQMAAGNKEVAIKALLLQTRLF